MLRNKTKIIAFFLVLFLLFSTTCVFADNETSEDYGTMAISEESETNAIEEIIENTTSTAQSQEDSYKNSDVYLAGDDITIDYIVDGNLFVFADTVTINSQIGGDAFIFAKNVIIGEEGYIFSNLFTIANSVEIKGVVFDVYAVSQSLTISNGYVYRDLKVACDTLILNGAVGRNASVGCSTINFNTDENSNGIIYGNLNYSSDSEISIPENVVNGEINYSAYEIRTTGKVIQSIVANYILDMGEFLAFVIIIWLICLWLAPKFLSNTNDYVGKKTLSILGYGALTLVAIPVACFILILLQLTSGFSLFLFALYFLAIILSKSLFTITANNYVCSKLKINKNSGIFGMLIVTGIVVWALTQIPYIGGFISFIISVLGLGILVASILPKKSEKEEIVVKNENDTKIDKE